MKNTRDIVAQEHDDAAIAQQDWRRFLEGMSLTRRDQTRLGPALAAIAGPYREDGGIVGYVRKRQQDFAVDFDAATHAIAATERRRVDARRSREGVSAVERTMNPCLPAAARPGIALGKRGLLGRPILKLGRHGLRTHQLFRPRISVGREVSPRIGKRMPVEAPLVQQHDPERNGVSPAHSTPCQPKPGTTEGADQLLPSSADRISMLQ